MNAEASTGVLRKMAQARQPSSADVPLTASRAVRLATTRAAENAAGLSLSVLSVAEDALSLDDLQKELTDDLLMVGLNKGGAVSGLMACDFAFAAATVEVRTMGSLSQIVPPERPVTGTDLKLTEPVLQAVLKELGITTPRTVLDGWADGAFLADRFRTVRRVGFDLTDVMYRLIRLSVDLGVDGRQGVLMIALPLQAQTMLPEPEQVLDWDTHFQAAVLNAPATLDAVLHQFQMPLHAAANLDIGQVIPLPGFTVGSVRLMSLDGKVVARGKLGQIAGQIAVRLEDAGEASLSDMPYGGDTAGMPAMLDGGADMLGDLGGGMMGDAAPGMMDLGGVDLDLTADDGGGGVPMGDMMAAPLADVGDLAGGDIGELPDLGQPMALDPDLMALGNED